MPSSDALLRRIQLGEDSTLELMRVVLRSAHHVSAPHPDGLADELAAMANASGGIVVLGVDDTSREILGLPLEEFDTIEAWVGAICRDKITPPLDIGTKHIDLPGADGLPRPVIVIEVPRSLWVHRGPGGYYRRVGHAKREMAPDMLARLFQQRSQARLISPRDPSLLTHHSRLHLNRADDAFFQSALINGEPPVNERRLSKSARSHVPRARSTARTGLCMTASHR